VLDDASQKGSGAGAAKLTSSSGFGSTENDRLRLRSLDAKANKIEAHLEFWSNVCFVYHVSALQYLSCVSAYGTMFDLTKF